MAREAEGQGGGRIVAVSTVLFDGYPMETAIAEIAEGGARHVEPAFIQGFVDFDETTFEPAGAKRIRNLSEAAGLGIHAVSAHFDMSHPEAFAMLGRRLGFAEEIGARVLITNAGPASARTAVIETIRKSRPRLKRWGGTLALENPGHGSAALIANAGEGAALVGAIGSEHVRLNHDAANVLTYSNAALEPSIDYRRAAGVVAHVHLKDVRIGPEGWRYCPIGSGDIDFADYLRTIARDLPLSLEMPLRLERQGCNDPRRIAEALPRDVLRAALRQSLDFVRSLVDFSAGNGFSRHAPCGSGQLV